MKYQRLSKRVSYFFIILAVDKNAMVKCLGLRVKKMQVRKNERLCKASERV
jgi:hypothetical protein